MTGTRMHAVTAEGVEVVRPNGRIWGVAADLVALATGFKQCPEFRDRHTGHEPRGGGRPGRRDGFKYRRNPYLGDCAHLGRIREAVEEGERIGSGCKPFRKRKLCFLFILNPPWHVCGGFISLEAKRSYFPSPSHSRSNRPRSWTVPRL